MMLDAYYHCQPEEVRLFERVNSGFFRKNPGNYSPLLSNNGLFWLFKYWEELLRNPMLEDKHRFLI
ncbi:hypothetical protein NIES22_57910 [Calothrix brevissima NIES-22]|nr:hypothetical protein NIES22_57910 [Calothrix brevissima NIES-22]